jgi:hypothetical protein
VVHPLANCCDAPPGRQIVGVSLAMIEFEQLVILRIEMASDLKTFTDLNREVAMQR